MKLKWKSRRSGAYVRCLAMEIDAALASREVRRITILCLGDCTENVAGRRRGTGKRLFSFLVVVN